MHLGTKPFRSLLAWVTFEDRRDADDSVKELDGTQFHGKHIRVEIARGPRGGRQDKRSSFGDRRDRSSTSRRSRSDSRESSDRDRHHHEERTDRRGRERYPVERYARRSHSRSYSRSPHSRDRRR
eukprot:Platyproteum_vivax@DN16338_c0_g1_i1.p2